jgi:hypothetical protein
MMKDRTRELSVQQLPCRFYGGDYKSRADRDGMAKFAFTRFLIPAFVRSGIWQDFGSTVRKPNG